MYMTRQVRFDKKTRVINELIRRIESGQMSSGALLPGENLRPEFNVSRGTLREALSELKRRNFIATQTGVGSIVTYDGFSWTSVPAGPKHWPTRVLACVRKSCVL